MGMLTNASFYESELRQVLELLKPAAHTVRKNRIFCAIVR